MDTQEQPHGKTSGPPLRRRFLWRHFVAWQVACLVLGAMVAHAAVIAQSYFAPLLIFPLLVGVGLGAMTVGLMRLGQVGNRPTVVLGTVLAVLLAVVGQHYAKYLTDYRAQQRHAETFRLAKEAFPDGVLCQMPQPPANLLDFMRQEAAQGRQLGIFDYTAKGPIAYLTWTIDGLLTLAATLAMVIPATRQPYCEECRSWYRVTRSGRTDPQTAGELADLAGITKVDQVTSARYRLLNCQGGCGPTALEICWQESEGGTLLKQTWFDSDCRDQIARALDESKPSPP